MQDFIEQVKAQLPNVFHEMIVFTQNGFEYSARFSNLEIDYCNGWYKVTTDGTIQTLVTAPNLSSAIRNSYDLMAETMLKPEMLYQ